MLNFKVIKHYSLGYGIVTKKENGDIGAVGFEDGSKKTMMLSNDSISNANLTFKDFVSKGLFEHLFDEWSKVKAKDYISDRHFDRLKIDNDHMEGIVVGTSSYRFKIYLLGGCSLMMECSCPVNGLCKHLYAAFKYAQLSFGFTDNEKNDNTHNKNNSRFASDIQSYVYNLNSPDFKLYFNMINALKTESDVHDFLTDALPFYHRDQYKKRTVIDLVGPLFANEEFARFAGKYMVDELDPLYSLTVDAEVAYLREINTMLGSPYSARNNRRQYLINAVLKRDLSKLLSFNCYSYEDSENLTLCFIEYLIKYDVSKEEMIELQNNETFKSNKRRIARDFDAKNVSSTMAYALFVDVLPVKEKYLKTITDNELIDLVKASDDPSPYFKVILSRMPFNDINKYQIIAEAIIKGTKNSSFKGEEVVNSIRKIISKMPDNYYLLTYFENNVANLYWRY